MNRNVFEIGYCLISKSGEVVAPFIPDLAINSHLDQYYNFLKEIGQEWDNDRLKIQKISIDLETNKQYYSQFKYCDEDLTRLKKKNFKHISKLAFKK